MPRLLTLYGLARELGVGIDALRRWIADGTIPAPGLGTCRPEVFTEDQVREIRRTLHRRHFGRPEGWRSARPGRGAIASPAAGTRRVPGPSG